MTSTTWLRAMLIVPQCQMLTKMRYFLWLNFLEKILQFFIPLLISCVFVPPGRKFTRFLRSGWLPSKNCLWSTRGSSHGATSHSHRWYGVRTNLHESHIQQLCSKYLHHIPAQTIRLNFDVVIKKVSIILKSFQVNFFSLPQIIRQTCTESWTVFTDECFLNSWVV